MVNDNNLEQAQETTEQKKHYALVTGASSGIGYEYARSMARRGYNLIIVSNEDEALHEKGEILRNDFNCEVVTITTDLGRGEAAKELYEECVRRGLEVEVLINNAGVYHDRDFLKDSEAFNMLILNLHVTTPAMLMYYFGQDMVRRHKGYILNMSSITSDIAAQRLGTYGATKAFLKNFSRSVYIELYHEGVFVTAVRPGAVATTLYNISARATKIGLALGYITTPHKLAERGVKAMFRGRAQITPGFLNHVLLFLVALLPTCGLRLIRRWKLF